MPRVPMLAFLHVLRRRLADGPAHVTRPLIPPKAASVHALVRLALASASITGCGLSWSRFIVRRLRSFAPFCASKHTGGAKAFTPIHLCRTGVIARYAHPGQLARYGSAGIAG